MFAEAPESPGSSFETALAGPLRMRAQVLADGMTMKDA